MRTPRRNSKVRVHSPLTWKVLPVAPGTLSDPYAPRSWIECYDFETKKNEHLIENVNGFTLSRDYKTLLYRSRTRFLVVKAGEKPPRIYSNDQPSRDTS